MTNNAIFDRASTGGDDFYGSVSAACFRDGPSRHSWYRGSPHRGEDLNLQPSRHEFKPPSPMTLCWGASP